MTATESYFDATTVKAASASIAAIDPKIEIEIDSLVRGFQKNPDGTNFRNSSGSLVEECEFRLFLKFVSARHGVTQMHQIQPNCDVKAEIKAAKNEFKARCVRASGRVAAERSVNAE